MLFKLTCTFLYSFCNEILYVSIRDVEETLYKTVHRYQTKKCIIVLIKVFLHRKKKLTCYKILFLRYLPIDKLTILSLFLSSRFENSSQNAQLVVGDSSRS